LQNVAAMHRHLGVLTGLALFAAVHFPLFATSHEHAGAGFADENVLLAPMFCLGAFAAAWFALPRGLRRGTGTLLRFAVIPAVLLAFVPCALVSGPLGGLLGMLSTNALALAVVPVFTAHDPDVQVPRAIAVSALVTAEWLVVARLRWGGLDAAPIGVVSALALAAVAITWEVRARRRVGVRLPRACVEVR
jgi:hypothetical protein